MEICVCIGSACHVNGSYSIISELKKLIAEHQLEDTVVLKVAFCLGQCKSGVTIKIDEDLITGVTVNNIREIFAKRVLAPLGR